MNPAAELDAAARPLRVGLTGGIASGKSTVAALLAAHGAVVIDADLLAREVVAKGTSGLAAIVDRFGEQILTATGELDRPALGRIVFADPRARADLEAIVHPAVRRRADELAAAAPADAVVVMMIPLLVETGQQDSFDLVVVVDLPVELQLERMRQRDPLTLADALARLAAQASREERLAIADLVIDNAGTLAELGPQVDRLWAKLTS